MLKQLTIKNYALISHLEMSPSGHLNVITGETGAGKSIMLGAVGLLMGNRADTKVLLNEEQKCVTEGLFDISKYNLKAFFTEADLDYYDHTVIRREISPGGKSRAFINDTPVNLDVLKKLGSQLMDIHSQHENLLLGDQDFQLKLIDAYSGNQRALNEYQLGWQSYVSSKNKLEALQQQATALREESDFINFQLEELVKAGFAADEQEKLESELKISEHAGDIKSRFSRILEQLSESEFSSRNLLIEAKNHLQVVSGFSKSYENLLERLKSLLIELDDILNEIENEESRTEFDPERSLQIRERLDLLYRLLKKHRLNSVPELVKLQDELQSRSDLAMNMDEALEKARSAYDQAEKDLLAAARKLSKLRSNNTGTLGRQIAQLLKELGISEASVNMVCEQKEPSENGADKIEILFSANKGIVPRPLREVASGGEFTRLMFCIKYIMAEKTEIPTLVLDEIDSGVSGEIAIKLGKLMKSMARNHQLIAISHLPQIAAKADTHFFVYKESSLARASSNIKLLSAKERVEEIAKMIGGSGPSKVALESAQELLEK